MGKGVTLPGRDQALAIASDLNTMFSTDNFEVTKARYHALKSHYPAFLEHKDNETGASRRQRTLRHAGWLLTADVDFGASDTGTAFYPAKKFRLWLRWLSWIEHKPPPNSVVIVNETASNETPAQAIKKTLYAAFDRPHDFANPASVLFSWQQASGPLGLQVEVDRRGPRYGIKITSLNVNQLNDFMEPDEDDI